MTERSQGQRKKPLGCRPPGYVVNQGASEPAPALCGQHIEFLKMQRRVEDDQRREPYRLSSSAHDPKAAGREYLLEKAPRKSWLTKGRGQVFR